ncbi:helix-turn-helix transcriptional regulator [Oculatella sp. FACHB-28]|uniref:helix-turn-helix domain-containing protein n=1 Tax=Oculatella sp. FACHB-28 TaxID=2692845 RepID=UPI001686DB21|nr:helix-turn-helix transcriptional regulator [Oculatella sp. FACHB-28]MBD2058649.1 helix-turn-helix transcriptional regulator [Oculatella sp. FACHB-28]
MPQEIADLVRELRQQLGLSQEKLAAKLGVSFRTVNRWENGHTLPSALALKQVEELLHQMSHSSKATVRDCGKNLLSHYFQERSRDGD